ncbi:DNA polymerase III subunit delta' [Shewanella intestini]|uniref:DNA-directed DNA polymerase n=1 Tax=Shewanella intestini TaxID=2017544 RepID=A0ABS5I1D8_9GAMM|nr:MULTISPECIES: DNA polymerase III subunit delta' [Shewanella]MBR9727842.1 DNA polymerase III subunit delta' [Shewanella intestini]MRG36165.1 DNA polymerase III subunit delta' [Shewanella sp. XMDDZSB0408]
MQNAYQLEQLPWLTGVYHRFNEQVVAKSYSHASLLNISRAMGGELLANTMAKDVLCDNISQHGACGQCKNCLLISAGNHPDLHTIVPDGHQIKVDQIRQLCQQLTQTAQQGGRRVALIFSAEKLNLAAANALLKTLEEPGKDTLLVLQVNHGGRLLPTITSRCQNMAFTAPSRQAIQQWLISQSIALPVNSQQKAVDVTWCLSVVGGPLELAKSLQNGHYQRLLNYRQDWIKSVNEGFLSGSLLSLSEDQIIDALNVFYLFLRQYMLKDKKTSPFIQANIVKLAGEVMHMCQKLSNMPSVNTAALCQQYVLSFRQLALS